MFPLQNGHTAGLLTKGLVLLLLLTVLAKFSLLHLTRRANLQAQILPPQEEMLELVYQGKGRDQQSLQGWCASAHLAPPNYEHAIFPRRRLVSLCLGIDCIAQLACPRRFFPVLSARSSVTTIGSHSKRCDRFPTGSIPHLWIRAQIAYQYHFAQARHINHSPSQPDTAGCLLEHQFLLQLL
jgi:hypothetical protein